MGGGWRQWNDGEGLGSLYDGSTFELMTTKDDILAWIRQVKDGKVISEDIGGLMSRKEQWGQAFTSSKAGDIWTYVFNDWERYVWLYTPWEQHIPVRDSWTSTKWWGDDARYCLVRFSWGNRIRSK